MVRLEVPVADPALLAEPRQLRGLGPIIGFRWRINELAQVIVPRLAEPKIAMNIAAAMRIRPTVRFQ